MLSSYPLPAFHFSVMMMPPGFDMAFQEVDGLSSKMETESVTEGGENRFTHQLPKSVSHPNLVLKRAVADMTSPLVLWCKSTLEGGFEEALEPKSVMINLLNELAVPVRVWSVSNALPVSWTVEAFGAMKNEVAIERVELSYTTLTRTV